jgi:hypothetical protein
VAEELDRLLAAELPPPLPSPPAAPLDGQPSPDASAASGGEAQHEEGPLAGGGLSTSPEPVPQRSDLRELLNGYLAHTRCEEEMAANLRRMLGLEPWRATEAVIGPKMGPAEATERLL